MKEIFKNERERNEVVTMKETNVIIIIMANNEK